MNSSTSSSSRPLSILLTTERFPPEFAGGGELLVWKTATGLRRAGHRVQVLTTGDPSIREFEEIPTKRLARHRYAMNFAIREISRMARQCDLIQTFNYHACLPSLIAAKRERKPIVCTMMALFGREWRSMRPFPTGHGWEAWERFLTTRSFDRTVFLSDFSHRLGISFGASERRSQVISPGLDLANYAPAAEKEQVIFFSGKLEARKGIYDLLDIASRNPQMQFEVMGWGPESEEIQKKATSNIRFIPFERGEPLRRRFANASIFFFPSRAETFGFVLLEAMASGCSVVSSIDLPFAGAHVRAGNQQEMEAALLHLWSNPTQAARDGRNNIEISRQFTWPRYTKQLIDLYQSLLERPHYA